MYIGKTPTSVPLTSSDITDGIISTAKIANDAATLAKMAQGTDGNLISYDASGNPVAVATGNDGQVLTSAGVGAVPAFETLPAGGLANAQSFYLSASKTIAAGTQTVIDTTWTALATTKVGIIGSASNVSVSSGIFSFATTGIYLVETTMNFYAQSSTAARYAMGNIDVTANNSSYSYAGQATSQISNTSGSNDNTAVYPSAMVDVDNTSNVKVRLSAQGENEMKTETQNNGFIIRFTKLAAT